MRGRRVEGGWCKEHKIKDKGLGLRGGKWHAFYAGISQRRRKREAWDVAEVENVADPSDGVGGGLFF